MSDFFDLFRKTGGPAGDLSSAAVGAAWKAIEKDADVRRSPLQGAGFPDKANPFEFPQIPDEELDVRAGARIVFHADPSSPGADRFRFLRMRLRELWKETKLRSLLITSALPHDGKSTVALNLATALAERGKSRVLLIEGDLHHSCLTPRLGLPPRAGVAECLEDDLNPLSAIRRLEPLGWYLLAAGEPHRNPAELFQTEALSAMMQKLSLYFDWILIDSPPVLPLTDALLLRQHTDASLMVVRAGQTPGNAVEDAITLLGRKHVLSVVLNCAERLGRLYSGYYYYNSPYYKRGKAGWAESKTKR